MSKEKIFSFRTDSHHLIFAISGLLMLIAGIYNVINGHYKYIPYIILGTGIAFMHMGFEIDFEKKAWREYMHIAFLKFGFWKSIRHYEYVLVRTIKDREEGRIVFKVFLKSRHSHQGIELATLKKDRDAVELGNYIAEKLNFDIVIDINVGY